MSDVSRINSLTVIIVFQELFGNLKVLVMIDMKMNELEFFADWIMEST